MTPRICDTTWHCFSLGLHRSSRGGAAFVKAKALFTRLPFRSANLFGFFRSGAVFRRSKILKKYSDRLFCCIAKIARFIGSDYHGTA